MILVDSSVWIDHLHAGDPAMTKLLMGERVLVHPFVIGELALGILRQRKAVLGMLEDLPQSIVATDGEALDLIHRYALFGLGIGFVDVHLLAATRLTPGASFWTRDKRLKAAADRLALAAIGHD